MLGAAAAGPVAEVGSYLLQQGPVGVLALIIGWFGWHQLKIERARGDRERDRADAERARADAGAAAFVALIERVLPALGESTQATRELLEYSRRDRH